MYEAFDRFQIDPCQRVEDLLVKIDTTKSQMLCMTNIEGENPSIDTLLARGLQISNHMCLLCNIELESVDHLFLHCDFAKAIRYWIFK